MDEGLVERSRQLGERLADWLKQVKGSHAMAGDVRSTGLYGCIEFKQGVEVTQFKKAAIKRGVHLLVRGRCLFVAPPLVITEKDLGFGLDMVGEVLENKDW